MSGIHTLDLDGLEALPPYDRAVAVGHLVEALAELDLLVLKRFSTAPALAAAGLRYVEDSPWADVASVLRTRVADCRSIAAWRIAELRKAGRQAKVHVVVYQDGRMHVMVEADGRIEDPTSLASGYRARSA